METRTLKIVAATGIGIVISAYILSEVLKSNQRKKWEYHRLNDHPRNHHENWDQVDESSWDSFPTSDPPGHY